MYFLPPLAFIDYISHQPPGQLPGFRHELCYFECDDDVVVVFDPLNDLYILTCLIYHAECVSIVIVFFCFVLFFSFS